MLMSSSSEFITLCRSQVALLTQGLGAALSIVYLTEELVNDGTAQTKLIPIVAYPETAVAWEIPNALALPPAEKGSDTQPLLLSESLEASSWVRSRTPELMTEIGTDEYQPDKSHSLLSSAQIVLPLMHEGVLMGLLVTGREDRPWNERERSEIERIAQTLAIARLLDQRREWFEQQLSQQQRLQAKQRDLLDNLLHQFRNPLTALLTFGKLLLKRFLPGDANRAVADSIIRESERLQELLQQFDQVIDLTAAESPQKLLPPAPLFMKATVSPANLLVPYSEATGATLSTRKDEMLFPLSETFLEGGLLSSELSKTAELCSIANVLEPLLASAWAIAGERNLDLQADIPPNLRLVKAKAKAVREALSNLIDNALKYTPSGGQIYVQAGLEQGHFQGIAVSNTGPGIPPEDLKHIFERHYRGVQLNSQIPGTGLGLAIAKDLIEQMQGEIQVFSPAQLRPDPVASGPGTTFIAWLPVA